MHDFYQFLLSQPKFVDELVMMGVMYLTLVEILDSLFRQRRRRQELFPRKERAFNRGMYFLRMVLVLACFILLLGAFAGGMLGDWATERQKTDEDIVLLLVGLGLNVLIVVELLNATVVQRRERASLQAATFYDSGMYFLRIALCVLWLSGLSLVWLLTFNLGLLLLAVGWLFGIHL